MIYYFQLRGFYLPELLKNWSTDDCQRPTAPPLLLLHSHKSLLYILHLGGFNRADVEAADWSAERWCWVSNFQLWKSQRTKTLLHCSTSLYLHIFISTTLYLFLLQHAHTHAHTHTHVFLYQIFISHFDHKTKKFLKDRLSATFTADYCKQQHSQ